MNEQCTCTYQHARCPIGYDLEGKSMQAHIAWQEATEENRIARAHAFADACIAYQKHVEQKPLYQNYVAQQSKETR